MSDDTSAGRSAAEVATGARLRCPECGSEAIVTGSGPAVLRCCGSELDVIFAGSGR